MTRSEEFLLAVFSGILLAFGIHDEGRLRSTKRNQGQGLHDDRQQLSGYWYRVGGYIRTAQHQYSEQQDTTS